MGASNPINTIDELNVNSPVFHITMSFYDILYQRRKQTIRDSSWFCLSAVVFSLLHLRVIVKFIAEMCKSGHSQRTELFDEIAESRRR